MNVNRPKKSLFRLILIVTIFLFPNFNIRSEDRNKQFSVGIILPLTGPLSLQGVPMQNGIIFAKEDLDQSNLIKIKFEDDGFLPKNTVFAAKNWLNKTKLMHL